MSYLDEKDAFPDQRLFEPDPELENRPPRAWDRIWPYVRAVLAAGVLVSLLYISGVYHALLLTPTPETVSQEPISAKTEEVMITLPVQVFLISEDGSLGTGRDRESVERIVANAANIWQQARIDLVIQEVTTIRVSPEDKERFLREPRDFILSIAERDETAVSIFLTGTLQGLNGVAFSGLGGLAVADVTSHYDFRTLAHEVGHLLGLGHTTDKTRLMAQGAYGNTLTINEIEQARTYAQRMF